MSAVDVATTVADVAAAVCLGLGVLLALVASLGVLRLPDVLTRLHAAAKPQALGIVLVVVGVGLALRTPVVLGFVVLVVVLQLVTAPVAAHMVGRAAYRTGTVRRDLLLVDELGRLEGLEEPEGGLPEGCVVVDGPKDEHRDQPGDQQGDEQRDQQGDEQRDEQGGEGAARGAPGPGRGRPGRR